MEAHLREYCRFCGDRKPASSLIDMTQKQNVFSDVYVKLYFINAEYVCLEDEALPKTICHFCYQTLDRTHSFLTNVKKVQETLRILLARIKSENLTSRAGTPDSPLMVINESADIRRNAETTSRIMPQIDIDTDKPHENNATPKVCGKLAKKKKHKKLNYCAHPKNWGEYTWLCHYCDVMFPDRSSLQGHCAKKHYNYMAYRCIDCRRKITEYSKFIEHVHAHHEALRFSCEFCNQTFKHTMILNQHRKQHLTLVISNLSFKSLPNNDKDLDQAAITYSTSDPIHENKLKTTAKEKTNNIRSQPINSIDKTPIPTSSHVVQQPIISIDAVHTSNNRTKKPTISIDATAMRTSNNVTKKPMISIDATAMRASNNVTKKPMISIDATAMHTSNNLTKKPMISIDATTVHNSYKITTQPIISVDATHTSNHLIKQHINSTDVQKSIANEVDSIIPLDDIQTTSGLSEEIKKEPSEDQAKDFEVPVSAANCEGMSENQAIIKTKENKESLESSYNPPMPALAGDQSNPSTTFCLLYNEPEIKTELLTNPFHSSETKVTTDPPVEVKFEPTENEAMLPELHENQLVELCDQALAEKLPTNLRDLSDLSENEIRAEIPFKSLRSEALPDEVKVEPPENVKETVIRQENQPMIAKPHENQSIALPCDPVMAAEPLQSQPIVDPPNNQAHLSEEQTNSKNIETKMAETPDTSENSKELQTSPDTSKSEISHRSLGFVMDNFLKLPPETISMLARSSSGKLSIGIKFSSRDLTPTLKPLLAQAAASPRKRATELMALLVNNKQIPKMLNISNMFECRRIFNGQNIPPGCQVGVLKLHEVIGVSTNEIKAIYRAKKWSLKLKSDNKEVESKQAVNKNSLLKTSQEAIKERLFPTESVLPVEIPMELEKNQESDNLSVMPLNESTAPDVKKNQSNLRNIPNAPGVPDNKKNQTVESNTKILYRSQDGTFRKLMVIKKRKQDIINMGSSAVTVKKIRLDETRKPNPGETENPRQEKPTIPANLLSIKSNTIASTIVPIIQDQNARSMPILDADHSPEIVFLTDTTNKLSNSVLQKQNSRLATRIPTACLTQLPSTSLQMNEPRLLEDLEAVINASPIVKRQSTTLHTGQSSHETQTLPALQGPFPKFQNNGGNNSHIEVDLTSEVVRIPMSSLTLGNQAALNAMLPTELSNPKKYLTVPIAKVPAQLQHKFKEILGITEIPTELLPDSTTVLDDETFQMRELQVISARENQPKVPVLKHKTVDKSWTGYRWACGFCPASSFESVSELREHSKVAHATCFTIKCGDCGEAYDSFANFVTHVGLHRRFLQQYCPYCNCKVEKSIRDKHIQTHKSWLCNKCGDVLTSPKSLSLHDHHHFKYKLDNHNAIKTNIKKINRPKKYDHRCHKCGLLFINFRTMNEHLATHKDIEYICDVCKKRFSCKRGVRKHIFYNHYLVRCQICNQDFSGTKQRKAHKCTPVEQTKFNCKLKMYSVLDYEKKYQKKHQTLIDKREKQSKKEHEKIKTVMEKPALEMVQNAIAKAQPALEMVQPAIAKAQPDLEMVQPAVEKAQPALEIVQPAIANAQPVLEMVQPAIGKAQPALEKRSSVESVLYQMDL